MSRFNLILVSAFCVCFMGLNAHAISIEAASFKTADGITLNGFWTLPDQSTTGAVIILQGSGNVGSDGDVSGPMLGSGYHGQSAKLSQEIAEALAHVGVASLRYEKRGFADLNELPHQTLPYLVNDAGSALDAVQSRFANINLGVVGLSEGATVATLLVQARAVKGLFLLSLPTRAIDDVLNYQFVAWPTELLQNHFDKNHTGFLLGSTFEAESATALPILGLPWGKLDLNQDGKISVDEELLPTYQSAYTSIRQLLDTPAYKFWYESYKAIPDFSVLAPLVQSNQVFIYQGSDDAQVRASWTQADLQYFKSAPTFRLYPGVGHCFSPMDGVYGEVKTTGPLSSSVLQDLANDVLTGLGARSQQK